MSEIYDVLIVGGGPAGSTCAWALRNLGLNVLIMDKSPFPRDKTCAGWITPQVLESLELDVAEYAGGPRVFQPITAFQVGGFRQPGLRIDFDQPVSYGIRRFEFDEYLLHRCGAPTQLNTPVRSIERTSTGWLVNEKFEARILVGAGGHFCPVARRLRSAALVKAPLVTAVEAEFSIHQIEDQVNASPMVPQLYFRDDLAGYGWCVRKEQFLNIGLGLIDSHETSSRLPELLQLIKEDRGFTGEVPIRFHGHAYHLHAECGQPVLDDGLLLIGDAAGLAYAQSGEGIRPAVESGILAAQTILSAHGNYDRSQLLPYQNELEHRFGKLRSTKVAGSVNLIPLAWRKALAKNLLKSRWFVRRVVLERWFLHRHQPALKFKSSH